MKENKAVMYSKPVSDETNELAGKFKSYMDNVLKDVSKSKDQLMKQVITQYLEHEPTPEELKLLELIVMQGTNEEYLRYNRKTIGVFKTNYTHTGVTVNYEPYENEQWDKKINEQQDKPPVETISSLIDKKIAEITSGEYGYMSVESVVKILNEIKEYAGRE